MNIFKFLTARTGAVSKAGLAGVVLAGGLAVYNLTGYMADSPAAQEGEIRSLAQVMASGGQMPSEYSGINISRGGTEFASAAEVSAQNDRLFDGGEGAIDSMNAALDGFSASRYALSGGEAGLGMGGNAAVRRDGPAVTTGGVSIPGEAGVREGLRQANEAQAGKGDGAAGPTLQRASITKASGSNLGAGGNGGFGASSGRGVSSAAAERASRAGVVGPGSLSGAMPDGSTLVASNSTLRGATSTSSSFRPGNINAHIGQGASSKEGKDLRRLAVASGKVAANANRSSNEADQVFMSGERLAGGVQVEDGSMMETAGTGASADFVDEMDTSIDNFNAEIDEIDTTEQEKKALRTKLAANLVKLLFATATAMIAISALKDKWPWGGIVALAVTAAALVPIAMFIKDAITYIDKYDGWAIGVIFTVFGAAFIAGLALAWFSSDVSNWINNIMGKINSALGGGSGGATSSTSTTSTTTTTTVNTASPGIDSSLPGFGGFNPPGSRLPPMM